MQLAMPRLPKINNLDQILSDIHIQKRGLVSEITGEDGERVPIIKNPINYSKTPMQYEKAPPKLNPRMFPEGTKTIHEHIASPYLQNGLDHCSECDHYKIS